MKTGRTSHSQRFGRVALAATFFASAISHAGTITQADPVSPAGGISYEWTAILGANDSVQFARLVGAWSWEDDTVSSPTSPKGWTHTSEFVAVTLTEPQRLTIQVERFATPLPIGGTASIANMNPSFTLWAEWDNDGAPASEGHTYANDRNISWAEDIFYVGHVKNNSLAVAEAFWDLPAGNYTIAIGSNAPADDGEDQGYRATLTTAVPEPASAALLFLGASALAGVRRRMTR